MGPGQFGYAIGSEPAARGRGSKAGSVGFDHQLAGEVNLSPFSFFNVFSANPPVLIFSPALRVRDGSSKHTLRNVMEIPEVVIQVVPFALVEQVSLASSEYAEGVNEFQKAGLTAWPSLKVAPPRVAESPVHMECKVLEVKPLGTGGGAGNLVICEVVYFHVAREVLLPSGSIDPYAVDAVARLGGDWYTRSSMGLFEVEKPLRTCGIGVDALPTWLHEIGTLDGNRLARLGNQPTIPTMERSRAIFLEQFPARDFESTSPEGRAAGPSDQPLAGSRPNRASLGSGNDGQGGKRS